MLNRLSFWLRCFGDWLVRASYRMAGDDPDCMFCGDNAWGTYACDRCINNDKDYEPEESA